MRPILTFCFLYLLFLPVCFSETFRIRLQNDAMTLDYTNGEVNTEIVTNWMQGLFVSNAIGRVVNGDAKSAKFNSSNKQLTVMLRKSIHWSDGKPICAKHYHDAIKRLKDPKFASPYSHYADNIKSTKFTGCQELRIEFKKPMPEAKALLAHYVFYPIRLDRLQQNPKQFLSGKKLLSNGPYLPTVWKPNNLLQMKFNDRYFNDRKMKQPKIKQVEFYFIKSDLTAINLYNQKKLDLVKVVDQKNRRRFLGKKDLRVFPTLTVYYLGINDRANDLLAKQGFRKNLSHSLERSELSKILGQEVEGTKNWVPEELQSKKELRMQSEISVVNKKDRIVKPWAQDDENPKIELFVYNKGAHLLLAQWIKSQWEQKLKLSVKIKVLEESIYWNRLVNDPPGIFLSGVTAPYFDAKAFLKEFYQAGSANWTGFRSRKYDELSYSNPVQAESILLQSGFVIPLYRRGVAVLLRPKWKNFVINPLDRVRLEVVTE